MTYREISDAEWDDGGTPHWRGRHARKSVWKQLTVYQLFLLGFFGPFILLFLGAVIIIGGAVITDLLW